MIFRTRSTCETNCSKREFRFDHPRAEAAIELYAQIYGLPRHLGQHSGGMIICQGALSSMVPLENASMPGRVVAQWDKDDCEDLGIIKVDLLGLGMMAAMQDAMTLCAERQRPVDIAAIPKDDPAVYDLMTRADTIGTFQVESRAQMATLPRLKPKCFYDVVVEVAIIRPGPIQGGMVHPYLARREGTEPVTYIDERLRPTLERTLGVPLFQEQLLKMAMVMADFSGSEAEELRRALSFHRSQEKMEKVCVETAPRHGGQKCQPRGGRKDCSIRPVLRRLWLPREPRDQLCPDRLCELLVESASNPGILLRPAQQSADGLLQQCHADS